MLAACFGVLATLGGCFPSVPQIGPSENISDQYRFFWILPEEHYVECRDAGFNLLINPTRTSAYWNLDDDGRRRHNIDTNNFSYARRAGCDGVDVVEKLSLNACKPIKQAFAQISRDGSKNVRSFDLNEQSMQSVVTSRFVEAAASVKDVSAIVGVHTSSEVRDGSAPSFSDGYRSRCWRELGYEMPQDIVTSRLTLKDCPDLPLNGVVATTYKPLEYLVWFWRQGDGWNDYQTQVADIYRKVIGKPLFSYFDPVVRAPALWGMGGTNLTFGGQWYYAVPQPYGISFGTSEVQAMARGTPGMGVFMFPSGIMGKAWALPAKADVDMTDVPLLASAHKDKHIRYITMPADLLRGAVWTLFSRKVDGIGTYAWNALFPSEARGNGFTCTDPTAFDAIRDAFQRVGVKLGPLFRAIPERDPEVAFLESYASSILASKGSMGWQYNYGDLLVAANLVPYVIYEEEIARRGIPKSVKLLVMPDTPVVTEPTFSSVKSFQSKGGVVASDSMSVPAIVPDVTLPDYLLSRPQRAMNAAADREVMHRAVPEFKTAVASVVKPYADSDNMDIRVHARSYRNADYVFAVNDRRTFGKTVGIWGRVPEKGLPNAGTVTVRRVAGAVYDLERETAVPFTVTNGLTHIAVDYTTTDGRILLVAPRQLTTLDVSVDGDVLVVRSADDDVMIPIAVSGEGTRTRYGVIEAGVWRQPVRGGTTVAVRNLADGRVYKVGAKGDARAATVCDNGVEKNTAEISVLIRARRMVRAELDGGLDPVTVLQSPDAAIRRYALLKLAETDISRARETADRMISDSDASVRMLAKRLRRNVESITPHEARSLSPLNDHEAILVKSVRVDKEGTFRFPKGMNGHEAIELWFGRPKEDTWVWLNGKLLGAFDADANAGDEFRLDATQETILDARNVLVIKNAKGDALPAHNIRAVAVRW